MAAYQELRGFVLTHRACGVLRGHREQESPEGYRLCVTCPCGARFERWLAADDADTDRLRAALEAFEA
jgi:hypothetical protein